jgi:hypothetical protein
MWITFGNGNCCGLSISQSIPERFAEGAAAGGVTISKSVTEEVAGPIAFT